MAIKVPHPQHRDMILVASYGGSGSTFLTQALGRYAPNRHIVHTHASPEVDF
jgi:hypothetical protein